MSADNYYLIRIHHGRFAVSMGFASDELYCKGKWVPVRATDPKFKRLADAERYAESEYAEYGPYYTRPVMAMVRRRAKRKRRLPP